MKITVFTSNQPRHLSLIAKLASIASEVFAVQECNTIFPGKVSDFFRKSEVMQTYFSHVISAENEVFGEVRFSPENVRTLSLKSGDLNSLNISLLAPALDSDIYVVFGASYIKGPLIEFLVDKKAINIHMGVSPYYRGSSCNFWAIYDGNPDLVGATIHKLSKGLDSGDILFHALPKPRAVDPFRLGMEAVRSAHESLVHSIASGELFSLESVPQVKEKEMRYTRNSDFNDAVAKEYLTRNLGAQAIGAMLSTKPHRELIHARYS